MKVRTQLDVFAERVTRPHSQKAQDIRSDHIHCSEAQLTVAQQGERLQAISRKGRKAAEEAHHEDALYGWAQRPSSLENREQNSGEETTNDVNQKSAERKRIAKAFGRIGAQCVPAKCADQTGESDEEDLLQDCSDLMNRGFRSGH